MDDCSLEYLAMLRNEKQRELEMLFSRKGKGMKIDGFTAEQIISIALYKGTADLLGYMEFDALDWREWCWIVRN